MYAYVISNEDLSIKDVFFFSDYEFKNDIEYASKSTITAPNKPNVLNDDYVVCKDGNEVVFQGICETAESSDSSGAYVVTLKSMESLFDREIFVGTESVISSAGIEDFIAAEMTSGWKSSGDSVLDRSYFSITATTHTPVSASVSTIGSVKDGVYNLKTFLGNAKEQYRIITDFEITASSVSISIYKDTAAELNIDTMISDVSNYDETYSVKALAKLNVKWLNTTTEVVSTTAYYLKTDRTITTNASDPDRAEGTIKAIYVEAASAAEMYEAVVKEFTSNSYAHKISLDLKKESRVYPASGYYVGRLVNIRTKTFTKKSIVTEVDDQGGAFVSVVFGKLKVTLIDKLRGLT